MAPIEYIIDPDPDTVITLSNPCSTFAPWELEQEGESSVPPDTAQDISAQQDFFEMPVSTISRPRSKKEKMAARRAARKCINDSDEAPDTASPQEPDPTEQAYEAGVDLFDESTMVEVSSSASHTGVVSEERAPSPSEPQEPVGPEEVSIRYYVSSRHLMLASPMLKRALLKDGFAESRRDGTDGLYHVEASDWDPEAFLIVLRIVHGRNKQVPREVTLEMLAKIAILEDYFNFGQALDPFTDIWIERLAKTPIPAVCCRNVVLWVWVAWVFDIEKQFLEATATAIQQSTDSFPTLGLPIPEIISGSYVLRS